MIEDGGEHVISDLENILRQQMQIKQGHLHQAPTISSQHHLIKPGKHFTNFTNTTLPKPAAEISTSNPLNESNFTQELNRSNSILDAQPASNDAESLLEIEKVDMQPKIALISSNPTAAANRQKQL